MTRQPGLPAYDHPSKFPSLVWHAVELTRRNDFAQACTPEVGRLLQLLAGGATQLCELGTAYGVGAGWIASGMAPGATLLTVEVDAGRAESARELFAAIPAVEVATGDWSVALERGLFDLVFSDGGPKRNPGDPEKLLPLLNPGGLVVLDDYMPGFGKDVSRDVWLESPVYRAVEIALTPAASVILATRR